MTYGLDSSKVSAMLCFLKMQLSAKRFPVLFQDIVYVADA
jgi:hypothetical protein